MAKKPAVSNPSGTRRGHASPHQHRRLDDNRPCCPGISGTNILEKKVARTAKISFIQLLAQKLRDEMDNASLKNDVIFSMFFDLFQ